MEQTFRYMLGQRIALGFHGTRLPGEFQDLIRKYQVGNVILFQRNIESADQLRELCGQIRELIVEVTGAIPFIIIDEEGGMVSRIAQHAVNIPGAMAMGATGDPENAALAAGITARQLRGLGPNFNMAPVLDVNTNRDNPVIGVRSYGDDPETVARFGENLIRGYAGSGILCCGKHFPGHGDTAVDSHLGLPCINKSLEELERGELIPFRRAIAAGVPAIMSSHILFPQIEPEKIPATMSRRVITGLLKEHLGFRGLVLSDCLEMNAIQKFYGTDRGFVAALQAGIDLAQISSSFELECQALGYANEVAEQGGFDRDEMEASVEKILAYKKQLEQYPMEPSLCNLPEDRALAADLARKAITCYQGTPFAVNDRTFFCGCEDYRTSGAANVFASVEPFPVYMEKALGGKGEITPKDPTPEEIQEIVRRAEGWDSIVFASCNAHLFRGQLALAKALAELGKPMMIVALRNPYDLPQMPRVSCQIAAFDYTKDSFEGLIPVFRGQLPQGKLPVKL